MTAPGANPLAKLTDQLAAAIAAAGAQDGNNGLGKSVYQLSGTVVSWDENNNSNQVKVNGTILFNLLVLQTGTNTQYFVGDTVLIHKMDDSYVIMGKLGLPGQNSPSQVQTATAGNQYTLGPTSGVWTNFPDNGPSLNVQVGASRRVLVFWSCDSSFNNADIEIGWKISGASTLAAGPFQQSTSHASSIAPTPGVATPSVEIPVAGFYSLQANGINPGLNTFTMQYRIVVTAPGTGVQTAGRSLAVIPL